MLSLCQRPVPLLAFPATNGERRLSGPALFQSPSSPSALAVQGSRARPSGPLLRLLVTPCNIMRIACCAVKTVSYSFEIGLAPEVVTRFWNTFIPTTLPQMEPTVGFYPAGNDPCPASSACFQIKVFNVGPATAQTDATFAALEAYAATRCGDGLAQ